MPQVSAAVLRSTPSSTRASASIRRAAALFFSPLAALRSSEAVRSSRVTDTAAPIDAAPLQKPASSQSFTDLGIPNESQFRAVGIRPIFDAEPFTVNGAQDGQKVQIWTADGAGHIGMMSEAKL